MIIRLIPPPPVAMVLFTVSFNTKLPSALPLPPFYSNQSHLLSQHDLEHPASYHSLDKSSWLNACLHEVVFDLSMGNGVIVLRCTFVDGDVKQWSFRSDPCLRNLNHVFRDVRWSAMQAEREKYEKYAQQLLAEEEGEMQPRKHKKQRSLLMSLVSCVFLCSSVLCADCMQVPGPDFASQNP